MSDHRDPERTRISSKTIPSWLVFVTVAVVVVAVVGFFVSGSPDDQTQVADSAPTTATPSPEATSSSPSPEPKTSKSADAKKSSSGANSKNKKKSKKKSDKPKADKPSTDKPSADKQVPRAYVEIYNNTAITGLADSTSDRVQGAGWKVVGVDNWYGNIPATTIYYPERLKEQAEILADDLGIDRVRPAVDPMKFDRLTLILTGQV